LPPPSSSLPPPSKNGTWFARDFPETVAELIRGIAHQAEIRVVLKARVRHLRSLKCLLGFVLGF
jgi:hypothetical protein